eukprot:COSAG02_NODE_7373_length_3044_cov_1.538540_3_plen_76_part_01
MIVEHCQPAGNDVFAKDWMHCPERRDREGDVVKEQVLAVQTLEQMSPREFLFVGVVTCPPERAASVDGPILSPDCH